MSLTLGQELRAQAGRRQGMAEWDEDKGVEAAVDGAKCGSTEVLLKVASPLGPFTRLLAIQPVGLLIEVLVERTLVARGPRPADVASAAGGLFCRLTERHARRWREAHLRA